MTQGITYLDLFSGIGGFALGLQKAGVKIKKHFFSEIDPHATGVYLNHFPNAKGLGDVKTIKSFSKFGKIDLITFGFPCQDLSIAGKGAGFNGTRSSLFYEAIRIIRATRPTHFIFENVKGLLSNDNGRTFEKVLQTIADIGLYDCEWQLVNTRWFLPQNRERIYFVGHLRGKSTPKVFPIATDTMSPVGVQRCAVNTLTAGQRASVGSYIVENQLLQEQQTDNIKGHTKVCPIISPMFKSKNQHGRLIKPDGEPSFTLTTQDRHGVLIISHNDAKNTTQQAKIRKLTPLECERLQGFPDGWTEGQSDNQRYKMLGNAVSVPIPQYIFNRLYNDDKKVCNTETKSC